jgi:hypothetical protein
VIDARRDAEERIRVVEEFGSEHGGLVGVEIGGAMGAEIVLDRRDLRVDPAADPLFRLGLHRDEIELRHQRLHARPQHARPLQCERIGRRAQSENNLPPAAARDKSPRQGETKLIG